jgi:ribosomal protein L27
MRIRIIAAALALGFALPAAADDRLVRFEGGIGVIPTGSANTVTRGVTAAGQIWVISRLSADVRSDGSITVDGRGLLLGAGNAVGRTNNASVFATLSCGAVAPFTEHSTNSVVGVALEPDGDFRINDTLTPAPPAECASPVLLIRNVANKAWFAAGIPKL